MELTPGTRLGPYELIGPVGAGGMGQVWQARDVNLDRHVAIKLVHDAAAGNPAWLARFEREARLLAALSHPNIATVYGLDEFEGRRYIVMEMVPGQTLARRLIRGALPLDEALQVGRQIAEALEAAHDQGIIHRDLKPANVMLTPEGKVKVLDFGLAQSTQPVDVYPDAVSQYERQTEEGVILGTPAYMAPEQARGRPVDRRCDLWALGCVMFEALTGRPLFSGQSFHDTLAAVIGNVPDWSILPAGVPVRVAELLRRCLQKDPHKRLRDAGDLRLELEESLAGLAGELSPSSVTILDRPATKLPPNITPLARRRRWWWPALAAAALALIAFALGRWSLPLVLQKPLIAETSAPVVWSGQYLLQVEPATYGPRVSPDGKWLAFVVVHEGQAQVGVMQLDSREWWVLTRNRERGQVLGVSWSRDSTRILFDRYLDVPAGVFSASPLDRAPEGAREVLVVEDASCPHATANGSLVVVKREPAGNHHLYHHTPGQALRPVGPPVEFERGWAAPVRCLHTSNKVIFCGKILDGKAPPTRRFYLLDLDTDEYRALGAEEAGIEFAPLAVSWRDDYFYTVAGHDDAFHIVRVPLTGRATPEPVLTLTLNVYGIDVDREGRLYVDQLQRPMVVLRFDPVTGGRTSAGPIRVERLSEPLLWRDTAAVALPLELPDGRLLMPTKVAGRDRLVIALRNTYRAPLLLDSQEETSLPAVRLGKDRLAFTTGSGSERHIRVAIFEDGVARLEPTDLGILSDRLQALASTPDGKTLYFVQSRHVFMIPTDGSKSAEKVAEGDALAADPRTGALLVQRFEGSSNRLYRLSRPEGHLEPVPVHSDRLRLAPVTLSSAAFHPDGRVLVTTAAPDSCHWQTALLEPDGTLQPVPVDFSGDVIPAAWTQESKILAIGLANFADLWRFTPAGRDAR